VPVSKKPLSEQKRTKRAKDAELDTLDWQIINLFLKHTKLTETKAAILLGRNRKTITARLAKDLVKHELTSGPKALQSKIKRNAVKAADVGYDLLTDKKVDKRVTAQMVAHFTRSAVPEAVDTEHSGSIDINFTVRNK